MGVAWAAHPYGCAHKIEFNPFELDMKFIEEQKNRNRRVYLSVISLAALSCGGTAWAQTNTVDGTAGSTNVTQLQNVTVIGQLDKARSQILPNLGATAYTHTADQIQMQSQGDNAPLNQIVLRSPGVAQDSAANGDLHVRGEHANLQYRINDVLLPEGITGFGLELDPRFINSLQLITGSLPAQYGFRTAGVVDIQTKSGAFQNGGEGEVYGGSFDTIRPSAEFGGSSGKFNYFVDGSYEHSGLGIENPTPSYSATHDNTDQFKTFTYMSYLLSDTSRLSFMGSASYANFQVPNTPGLPPGTAADPLATPWYTQMPGQTATSFNSADLNEQQREQNYYGVLTYQKSVGDFNGQFSVYGRSSGVHFRPDGVGDLYYNGVASDVERKLYSEGFQADCSYDLSDNNTIRGGGQFLNEAVFSDSMTTVFPVDITGAPDGVPFGITDNHRLRGLFGGVYLQDEWTFFKQLTFNYGARFDVFNSSFDNEVQLSPRVNVIWKATSTTTLHAGYSRYFTPPPIENVSGSDIALFNGTSNGSATQTDDPVKAERSDYFDVGASQQILPGLTVGVDGYYKYAHNQLDDGLFGQTLILSAFNYAKGKVYGVEFTGNYTFGNFSTYANVAWSQAQGEDWTSAQFLFSPSDLAYVQNHWIYLDHDQRVTGSFGAAYTLKEDDKNSTRVYVDALYGSGLRTTINTPNDGSVPAYYSVNLGVEQDFKLMKDKILKARLDVVNLTDNVYQLRDGSGVGVNAAQYGERLGFFGSVSFVF
jgi:outer membrane receptor protein involved in Fe transport